MSELLLKFPNLTNANLRVISPKTPSYNCIAWAAGDISRWWEPDPLYLCYWPQEVLREWTIDAIKALFVYLGYEECESEELEEGYEKVAIFVKIPGIPKHVARQLPNGRWTSKCGKAEDIEHDLHGVSGDVYGNVSSILRRHLS